MKKKRFIWVPLLAISTIAFYGCKERSPGASSPQAIAQSKFLSAKEELQLAESRLVEVAQLLGNKQYQEAAALSNQAFARLEEIQQRAPSSKDSPAIGTAGEIERLRAQMKEMLTKTMRDEIDALRAGAPDNRNVSHLQRHFGHTQGIDLWSLYESAIPELDAIRSKRAPRWIRIYNVANINTDYDDLVFKALADRVIAPPGYQVAFGPPVGALERRALFCTIDADIRPGWNTYSLSLKNRPYAQLAKNEIKLLVSLDLHLSTETRIDSLDPFIAGTTAASPSGRAWKSWGRDTNRGEMVYHLGAVPIGAQFELQAESTDDYAARHNQRLDATIRKGLARMATIDVLQFYNAQEAPVPLSIGQALSDRNSFISALRHATPGSEPAKSGWVIVAALGIDELQKELTDSLSTLDSGTRKAIAAALAAQPGFGDYAPLMFILKHGTVGADGDFPAALDSLRADVFADRFWAAIQTRIEERPELAKYLFAQARYARIEHLPQVFECYNRLPPEMAGRFITEFIVNNDHTKEAVLSKMATESNPAKLLGIGAALGAHFRDNKHPIPSKAEQTFLLETISKLKDSDRAAAIYSTGGIPSLWAPLFQRPRTDWSPSANLAIISTSLTASNISLDARKAAFRELCLLATGAHHFTAKERQTINAILPALLDTLSNNGASPDMNGGKLATLLLSQPPDSPHDKAFSRIIPDLLPGSSPYFSMGHPDALAVIELALKHHRESVRESAIIQIRAHAPNNPAYQRLLPP